MTTTPTLPDNLIPTITYTVQSTENTFTYSFYVVDSDDMYVYVNGVEISSNNYTITGIGDTGGGFVEIDTNLTPLKPGDLVTLSRFTLPEQLTQFLRTGDFTAASVNAEFNRLYAVFQEQTETLSRAITVDQGQELLSYNELIEQIDEKDQEILETARSYTDSEIEQSEQEADEKFVNVSGDTMVSPLAGPDSQKPSDYMPQSQVVEVVDDRIASIPGFDPNSLIDYGFVASAVGDEFDYGSV